MAKKKYQITIVGLGYVGLANAVLLAQHNDVTAVDISEAKIQSLNKRKSPIFDVEISKYLKEKDLKIRASTDLFESIKNADYIIIATPTDYNVETKVFDTSSVEKIISEIILHAPDACIVIKSTIPVGFVEEARIKYNTDAIIFSPEFLREGRALHDNLYPSRIIVGEVSKRAQIFADLLSQGALKSDIEILLTGSNEAEAIKLFSNTYLAMRVAFFNELDSFALTENLDTREIITGVSLDPRIGSHYNNPSFGYGGYCLPKDTKQLMGTYKNTPQKIIKAIVQSNTTRQNFLASKILEKQPKVIGVYRLIMKSESDNFRQSSIMEIINILKNAGKDIIIYEPSIEARKYENSYIEKDLNNFKINCDLIIANRMTEELRGVIDKVFTRDLFGNN
ncbi:nucleotide sugar dehydrogenase [Amylibacter sp.]|nr:nucleotide sugar dehydrogenase [Amylibacter sp.]